jgi:hypothetical protein
VLLQASLALALLAAAPAGDPASDLREARAQALRAQAGPAAAEEAWMLTLRAAERALRALAPEWARAVDRGEDAGRAARLVGAPGAEALYLVALGGMGMARQRGFAALLMADGTVRPSMERAAALDERLDGAGPRRALGAWLAVLPSAGGGGAARSRAAFARARELEPRDMRTPLAEAETLAVLLQDRALFQRLLEEVLRFDPASAPELRAGNEIARRRAQELQDRADRLF